MPINRTRIAFLTGLLTTLPGAAVAAQYYATTGNYSDMSNPQPNVISYTNHLYEMSRHGIGVDRVVLTDSPDATVPGKLHGYQIAAMMVSNAISDAQLFTGQRRIIVDLSYLFFEPKTYPSGVSCTGYNSSLPVTFRFELRRADANGNGIPDYRDRMNDFVARIFGGATANDFEFISVNAESGCVPAADITAAAQAVKDAIPGVRVSAGYPISIDVSPATQPGHGLNHIGKFPAILDRVITWSYGVFNPAASHPLNVNGNFASYYSQFLAKMHAHQSIDWVTDGHFIHCRHGSVCYPGGAGMGWIQGLHHAQSAVNWCNWLPGQSRIAGNLVFTYGTSGANDAFFSVAEMPQIVRDTHAMISSGACVVPQTLVAADAFTNVVAGTNLHGRVTEVGGKVWTASPETRFASGGPEAPGDVTGTTGSGPFGTLPYTPASQGNRPVTVTADVNPAGAGWLAIGFANHANWGWWVDGQVWVLIKNSSRYDVLANGTALSLTGGERFDAKIRPNQLNRVELTYEPLTRRVSLWINGWQLLPPTIVPSGFVPAINYAGWSGLNVTQAQSRLDSFELKVAP